MSTTGKNFDPKNATPGEVQELYLAYIGVVALIGDVAPHFIRLPDNEERVEQVFEDCLRITGMPYKRTLNRFDLRPDRKKTS